MPVPGRAFPSYGDYASIPFPSYDDYASIHDDIYFLALPLLFTRDGGEGANDFRSNDKNYLNKSVLIPVGLVSGGTALPDTRLFEEDNLREEVQRYRGCDNPPIFNSHSDVRFALHRNHTFSLLQILARCEASVAPSSGMSEKRLASVVETLWWWLHAVHAVGKTAGQLHGFNALDVDS